VGDAAIAAWARVERRLVGLVGDTTLAERFQDLEEPIPAQPGLAPVVASPLLHNPRYSDRQSARRSSD